MGKITDPYSGKRKFMIGNGRKKELDLNEPQDHYNNAVVKRLESKNPDNKPIDPYTTPEQKRINEYYSRFKLHNPKVKITPIEFRDVILMCQGLNFEWDTEIKLIDYITRKI